MPAVTDKQQRFMGAELARKRAGKKTQTGMSEAQLEDFARKKAPAGGRVMMPPVRGRQAGPKKPPKPPMSSPTGY